MKKKVIAIVVMVALVMSLVACGSTQAQPVQESTPAPKTETTVKPAEETKVETPVVTEEPKVEESEVKEEPAAEPVTEETPGIIDGIDFTLYDGTQESLETIIKEQVTYDTLKAFVCDTKTKEVKEILSDGDSIVVNVGKDAYFILYYAPKDVSKVEQIGVNPFDDQTKLQGKKLVASWNSVVIPLEKGENIPLGLKVTYQDGTEETLELNATFK